MAVIRSGGVLTGKTLTDVCAGPAIGATAGAIVAHCGGNLNHYGIGDIVRTRLLNTGATAAQLREWNKYVSEMLDPGNPAHLPATIHTNRLIR